MLQPVGCKEDISLLLSEVLNDIGVNERVVMTRRRSHMLRETLSNIISWSFDQNDTVYHLGSQSEGTTTTGLNSDLDILYSTQNYNVCQDLSEWEHGKLNYLMIQDENTAPGYCFLQLIRPDEPQPMTIIPDEEHVIDKRGRILLTNKNRNVFAPIAVQTGPSLAISGRHPDITDQDLVKALRLKSPLRSISVRFEKEVAGKWVTQEMRQYAAGTDCFVVGTGSKLSVNPELEWRISTSLAERCLMFNLNITQIRCYVLMKMILKSFLNAKSEAHISSFMCKTILLHDIENTDPGKWKENNLLTCLSYCMLKLRSCVKVGVCPHFIIRRNNLMAGKLTATGRQHCLENIDRFLENDIQMMLKIGFDDLGQRLQIKLNFAHLPIIQCNLKFPLKMNKYCTTLLYINFVRDISIQHLNMLKYIQNKNLGVFKTILYKLLNCSLKGNAQEQISSRILINLLVPSFVTFLVSSYLGHNKQVPPGVFTYFSEESLNSDVTSSRLKLASVFYCSMNMKKTESILRFIENQYFSSPTLPSCGCWEHSPPVVSKEFESLCNEVNIGSVKHLTAFCVRFIPNEINCVPRELQYEMYRLRQDDMLQSDPKMLDRRSVDWSTIDSLPYLYFLQYKTYHQLGKFQCQQQALQKLSKTIETEKNLYHRDTGLNILGQCLELENRPQLALNCYIRSLKLQPRNNVACIHICKLICSLLVDKNEKIKTNCSSD